MQLSLQGEGPCLIRFFGQAIRVIQEKDKKRAIPHLLHLNAGLLQKLGKDHAGEV